MRKPNLKPKPKMSSTLNPTNFSKYHFVKSYSPTAKIRTEKIRKEKEDVIIAEAIRSNQDFSLKNLTTKKDLEFQTLLLKKDLVFQISNLKKEIENLKINLKNELTIRMIVIMTSLLTAFRLMDSFFK